MGDATEVGIDVGAPGDADEHVLVGGAGGRDADGAEAASKSVPATKALVPRKPFDMTVNDRRFLRSLRIAAEEAKVEETN